MPNDGERSAPRKLFREEAHPDSVQCLACGAPITLHAFGQIEQVSCAYCGSTLSPDQSGALELLQRAERERRPSALPLHARGTVDDVEWEVVGIIWRQVVVDGVRYPWQEFMLFNPYAGYRWLVYGMTDGKWMFGRALDGAPEQTGLVHKALRFKNKRYKHFTRGNAEVIYVEGEFPWQVEVDDRAVTDDFVSPPEGLSVEKSSSAGESEINFTLMRHIDAAEVWAAFGQAGAPPPASGVGMIERNPHHANSAWYRRSFAALFGAWLLCTFVYLGMRDDELVVHETEIPHASVLTKTFEIGEAGKKTTAEFSLHVPGLSNAWAYAEVLLVRQGSEDALVFGVEADEWHGSDYKEGSNPGQVVIGELEGGTYTLQVMPQFDPQLLARNPGQQYGVDLRHDVPLGRYVALSLFVIVLFPLINFVRRLLFEARRWQNSDYASES